MIEHNETTPMPPTPSTDATAPATNKTKRLKQNLTNSLLERLIVSLPKAFSIVVAIFIGVQALMFILGVGVLQWAWLHDDVVEKSVSAGRAIAATQTGGFFSRGAVETDRGYYLLATPLSVQKQEQLSLEYRSDRSRYLCDGERRCAKLVNMF